jgi:hypothetical protein
MRDWVVDESDMATEREMLDTELAIKRVRMANSALPLTGFCYNCDEPLPSGLRFCNADCRDDWEIRNNVG